MPDILGDVEQIITAKELPLITLHVVVNKNYEK
jgi:hypothetical protein